MSISPRAMMHHQNYLEAAIIAAKRSTCVRRKVGCVAVKDDRIIASGFNGVARRHEHCRQDTCIRTVQNIPSGSAIDKCLAIHAEQNVIIQAATSNQSLSGATIYCTTLPCSICLNMLFNCRVKEIFFLEYYNNEMIDLMLKKEAAAWGPDRILLYHAILGAEKNALQSLECINSSY